MSQFDFGNLVSPLPGSVFIDDNLEPWRDALHSGHSGVSRPSYVVEGMWWIDTSTTPWVAKVFQGSDDIVVGSLDPSTLVFTPSGIQDGAVTNDKLSPMPENTVKVRQSGAGAPQDLAMAASTFLARLASGDIVAATVAQARTLLGLGSAAYKNTGTTGDSVPLNNTANAFSERITFGTGIALTNTSGQIQNTLNNDEQRFLDLDFPAISSVSCQIRMFRATNSSGETGLIIFQGDNTATVSAQFSKENARARAIFANTTATAANVNVDGSGNLTRSTSSIVYKRDIEDVDEDYAYNFLDARPVWYRSKIEKDNPNHSFWGFIAEELAEVDPRLVFWEHPQKEVEVQEDGGLDDEGNPIIIHTTALEEDKDSPAVPTGVQYERITVMHHVLIKKLFDKIEELETKIQSLE